MITLLQIGYILALAGISLYGLLGLVTLYYYWQRRHDRFPAPTLPDVELPAVTVQLPIYNERLVVERLTRAAINLDYPCHKLHIQIVDDSTDETTVLAGTLTDRYRQAGYNIEHCRRPDRAGFKAGALQAALASATGEFIAIFDADFAPKPDFLRQTIPHFAASDRIGMVQARWGHLNADDSPLTAAQAIALDKHFAIEQTVRHRADLFPKFNGAAGIWRRACIDDAGGWEADTLTEDLCLSSRAVLREWECRFLPEVAAPAELPASIAAYKNQQARWAQGSTQCLFKFGGRILGSRNHSWTARLYAVITMSAYATHLLLLTLLGLSVPLAVADARFSPLMILFGIAGIAQPLLFIISQRLLYPDWNKKLRHLPTLLLVAAGIAPSASRGVLGAIFARQTPFVRTPKGKGKKGLQQYRLPFDWIVFVEVGLAIYAGIGLIFALYHGNIGPLFLLLTCLFGFAYVAWLTIQEQMNG